MKRGRLVLILLSNVCVFAVGIAICELAFGDWFAKDLDAIPRSVPRNVAVRYDVRKLYPTSRESITYTRDGFGLRGNYASVGDIDILVVGGSTTDQRYIDDNATWDAVMQQELRANGYDVTVANAGLDGQSTVGHIRSFKHWFSQIPQLRPSYVIFYVGINDSVYLREPNDLHGTDTIESSLGIWDAITRKSAFYQIFQRTWGTYKARQHGLFQPVSIEDGEVTVKNILDDIHNPFSTRSPDARPGNLPYLEVYEKNLLALNRLSKELGATAIFASQPAGTCRFEGTSIMQQDGTSFDCLSLAYLNRLAKDVSQRNGFPFINVAALLTLTRPSEVYDYIHANERGAEMLGKLFASLVPTIVDMSEFSAKHK